MFLNPHVKLPSRSDLSCVFVIFLQWFRATKTWIDFIYSVIFRLQQNNWCKTKINCCFINWQKRKRSEKFSSALSLPLLLSKFVVNVRENSKKIIEHWRNVLKYELWILHTNKNNKSLFYKIIGIFLEGFFWKRNFCINM